MEEKLDKLDRIMEIASINFYSLGNAYHEIELQGFNTHDLSHLGLLYVARNAANIFNFKISIRTNIFKYLVFKFKNRKKFKVYYLWHPRKVIPTCNEFIRNIEVAQTEWNAFKRIYDIYVKEK